MSDVSASDETPEQLHGGTVNQPVRIGDTVRRRVGPWAEAVHELLLHLEAVGFPYSPRFLGIDDEGREVLSYIPGSSVRRPWPPSFRSLSGICQTARVVRLFHAAVADYRPTADTRWFNGRATVLPGEIVIHGDLGPWNVIVDEAEAVTGIIDWDFARPGHASSDLAYLAYHLTMLRPDEVAASAGFAKPPDRRARLRALAEVYGIDPITLVTEAFRTEFEQMLRIRHLGPGGHEPWAGFLARGMDAEIEAELDWLASNVGEVVP